MPIRLKDHTNVEDFNRAVGDLQPQLLTSRIDRSLKLVRDVVFAEYNGGRGEYKLFLKNFKDLDFENFERS